MLLLFGVVLGNTFGDRFMSPIFMVYQHSELFVMYSQFLNNTLGKPLWLHGTKTKFNSWSFPPPMKDALTVRHSAVFFTTNYSFAQAVGPNVACVSLREKAKVLDATSDYSGAEQLRQEVASHALASRLINVNQEYWHNGWKDGSVLRMAFQDPQVHKTLSATVEQQMKLVRLDRKVVETMVLQNATRGFIELICDKARALGYDALFGYEIDRHSVSNSVLKQPWLAVLRRSVVSDPEWIS